MKTTDADRLLLDTNVLLDATNMARPRHAAAIRLLARPQGLVICAQVIREYLVVATRPVANNGLGMDLADAMANIDELRRVARLLPEERPVLPTFLSLLEQTPCHGKLLHDAFLVATMRAHGVKALATSNPRDFSRFADEIDIVEP